MSAPQHHARANVAGQPGRGRSHAWLRDALRPLGVVAAVVLAAMLLGDLIVPDSAVVTRAAGRSRGPAPAAVHVALAAGGREIAVPRSYLGVSTEYWALPWFERRLRVFERVLSILHVPGNGPFVLRIGGESADQTFWELGLRRPPKWVFGLTPGYLARTRALVRQAHLRLIIDLNLVTGSPTTAALWAREADQALPRGSISGFEIGNEPDIYSLPFWMAVVSPTGFGARALPLRLSARLYAADFVAYARAIARAAPGIPLLGPAIANPLTDAAWVPSLLRVARRDVGTVTGHKYPLSACAKPRSPAYPTVARLLGERASAGMGRAVRRIVSFAHRAGLPFRLTEMNSITCGGRRGVSDTFATALWAPDALFELMRAGVNGANVHLRDDAINAAFTLGPRGLGARPLLYGLALFVRTLGPDARLEPLVVRAPWTTHVKVWAVRTTSALHVLVIDKGRRAVAVRVQVPAPWTASVQRLTAASASASSGVTLAGQALGPDARWRGPHNVQTVEPSRSGYDVTVSGLSAALLIIPQAPPVRVIHPSS